MNCAIVSAGPVHVAAPTTAFRSTAAQELFAVLTKTASFPVCKEGQGKGDVEDEEPWLPSGGREWAEDSGRGNG